MKTPPNLGVAAAAKALQQIQLGTFWNAGLPARSRALCGHLGHARLANRMIYWLRRSSPTCLASRLAIIPGPS